MQCIVIGVDFSPPSKKALDNAVKLAKSLAAQLVIVHANSPLPPGAKQGHLDPVTTVRSDLDADEVERLGKTWVAEASRHAKVEFVAKAGKAADVILDEVRLRKALYVVVGSHGRTGIKKAVLGSVAHAVLAASSVPVLVVTA